MLVNANAMRTTTSITVEAGVFVTTMFLPTTASCTDVFYMRFSVDLLLDRELDSTIESIHVDGLLQTTCESFSPILLRFACTS